MQQRFDLITQFGCFSVTGKPLDFGYAIGQVAAHLAPDGVFIGANWRRTSVRIAETRVSNRYLSSQMVAQALRVASLHIDEIDEVRVRDDPAFDRVVLWCASKRRAAPEGPP